VSALGWTRRDTSRLALLDGLAIGGAGAVLGVLFAVALSPIFPIGIARVADPDIGWHLDWQLVTVALAATVILVAALSMLVSVGRVRAHRGRASAVTTAGPRIVRARPDVMTGLSFNRLSQGRGERPAALFSLITCVGVVALLSASGVLLASLDHLVAHRELAGATWQAVMLPTFDLSEEGLARGLDTVRHVPGVAAAGRGGWASSGGVYDGRVVVNGVPVEGQIFDDTGEIRPAIRRGRAPMSAGEVALGAKEMRALDVDIGDAVTVSAEVGGATIQGRVVGEAVLASPYFVTFPPGTGAATVLSTFAEVGALQPETAPFVFVRYADDADPLHTFDSIETALGNSEGFEAADRQGSTGLDRIRAVPELLIVGLLALIAVALAHVLLVSVRRHRRDLAVLSTLGFTHRQTWLAVVVQGAEIALLVCALGVPIGVVAGRITWDRIADGFYVVARPIAPVLFLLGLVLALLAVASLAALLPAARAMRLRPAQILRSDFA